MQSLPPKEVQRCLRQPSRAAQPPSGGKWPPLLLRKREVVLVETIAAQQGHGSGHESVTRSETGDTGREPVRSSTPTPRPEQLGAEKRLCAADLEKAGDDPVQAMEEEASELTRASSEDQNELSGDQTCTSSSSSRSPASADSMEEEDEEEEQQARHLPAWRLRRLRSASTSSDEENCSNCSRSSSSLVLGACCFGAPGKAVLREGSSEVASPQLSNLQGCSREGQPDSPVAFLDAARREPSRPQTPLGTCTEALEGGRALNRAQARPPEVQAPGRARRPVPPA